MDLRIAVLDGSQVNAFEALAHDTLSDLHLDQVSLRRIGQQLITLIDEAKVQIPTVMAEACDLMELGHPIFNHRQASTLVLVSGLSQNPGRYVPNLELGIRYLATAMLTANREFLRCLRSVNGPMADIDVALCRHGSIRMTLARNNTASSLMTDPGQSTRAVAAAITGHPLYSTS